MVIAPEGLRMARIPKGFRAFFLTSVLAGAATLVSACASSDQIKLKESREHYLRGDAAGAEALLYSPDVLEHEESRLQHYLWLSSVAMSQGLFEKALFYLERSRSLTLELRSDRGGFDWFSKEYKSNPVEFSYVQGFLVLSNLLLADAGETPAWSVPELKLPQGGVLVPAQSFPARKYSPAEVAQFRTKARAELLAWDQHLTVLKRTFPDQKFYQEDVFARILGGFVHGSGSTSQDRRTGELLALQAKENLPKIIDGLPTLQGGRQELEALLETLASRAKGKGKGPDKQSDKQSSKQEPGNTDTLVIADIGAVPAYRSRKVVVGLSLLFQNIENPVLRAQLEQIGFQVLFQLAPEFGLIAFTGAMVGAASSSDDEDPPRFLTDAVDQGLGFGMAFPALRFPDSNVKVRLKLVDLAGKELEVPLPVLSPLQEILARELRERMDAEWSKKAIQVGLQYLGVLVPAVIAYRAADQDQNLLAKIGILAGYMIAKKAIDRANAPDLRSWALLPSILAGGRVAVPEGRYRARLEVVHSRGSQLFDWGEIDFARGEGRLLYRKAGEVPAVSGGPGAPVATIQP